MHMLCSSMSWSALLDFAQQPLGHNAQDPEDWGNQKLHGGSSDSEDANGGVFRAPLAALPGITEEAPFELRALEVGTLNLSFACLPRFHSEAQASLRRRPLSCAPSRWESVVTA